MNSTVADLAFVPWELGANSLWGEKLAELEIETKYPNYHAWLERLTQRPAVKKMIKDKAAAVAASSH